MKIEGKTSLATKDGRVPPGSFLHGYVGMRGLGLVAVVGYVKDGGFVPPLVPRGVLMLFLLCRLGSDIPCIITP